jgi:flavin-dependent dehydrogenase
MIEDMDDEDHTQISNARARARRPYPAPAVYERYDVVIVGGRVAGAALAAHIARRGISALVVERAAFPSDTLSTHLFQNLGALERLGVLDKLLATGAPRLTEFRLRLGGVDLTQIHPDLAMLNVRRRVLDPILLDAAIEAGADALTRTRVIGLLNDGGRVTGVRIRDAERRETDVRARVVVGADGRNSTVANLVGARRYNVTDSERSAACCYYRGVDVSPVFRYYTEGSDLFFGCSGDNGLFLAAAMWNAPDYALYKDPTGTGFGKAIAACPPLAELIDGAEPTRTPLFMRRWQGFFRESAGPGWALVGDAGHFKDPSPGLGISDALRQAERLADAICLGIDTHTVEPRLHAWWRWRDADAAEWYWWAREFGRAGEFPPVIVELLRGLARKPKNLRAMHEILFHERRPFRVMSPPRVLAATARLVVRGDLPRGRVLAETARLTRRDAQRRWRTRRPRFEEPGA